MKRAKDKKMQLLVLTCAHLLENQFAIFLLIVVFKGIRPDTQ